MRSRRSCDLMKMSKSELLIHEATSEVEKMGADVLLTSAVSKLQEARDDVAEFIEREFTEREK